MIFKRVNLFLWMILGGICIPLSCSSFPQPPGMVTNGKALAPSASVADTVSIEIFIVRLDPNHNELLQQLWQEVDEQSLPPKLRRELLEEGLRVGVLGNLITPALARLLNISAEGKTHASWGEFQEYSAADAARETVKRNVRVLMPDMHAIIKVFDDQHRLPELIMFRKENGMLCAQTYTNATGLFFVSAAANKDGSAQFQILPAIEYGIPQQHIRVVAGTLIQDAGKPRHPFDSLTVSQRLLPGQWLIMGTTTPDSAGAGKAFFVRKDSALDQRLLAIRLSHVAPATSSYSADLPPPNPRKEEAMMPERN